MDRRGCPSPLTLQLIVRPQGAMLWTGPVPARQLDSVKAAGVVTSYMMQEE